MRAVLLLPLFGWLAWAAPTEEKSVLDLAPTLSELGDGWTTNRVLALVDPQRTTAGVSSQKPATVKGTTNSVRTTRKARASTGWVRMEYGKGDLLLNQGAYFVSIQRWTSTNALEQAWNGWTTRPDYTRWRGSTLGENCYWTEDAKFHGLTFRRGLFHVVVTCGARSDHSGLLRLAEVIDAKIVGRRIPEQPTQNHSWLMPPDSLGNSQRN
jgi:hypothetical protein